MPGHFISKCECGIVLAQCKCPTPDKPVQVVTPCVHAHELNTKGLEAFPSGVAAYMPIVRGKCPSCDAKSLFLAVGGHVTCASLSCKDPMAAAFLIGDFA